MCVTCLGNNQHTHNNHNNSSAPLHNLNKKIHKNINTQILNGKHRHVCMHARHFNFTHLMMCENVAIKVLS
jgi:hypothetical protein